MQDKKRKNYPAGRHQGSEEEEYSVSSGGEYVLTFQTG